MKLIPSLLLLALLAGCSSTPPSEFFLLHPLSPKAAAPAEGATPTRIQLESVELPGHLERPVLLSRPSPGRVAFSDFERWGEPLGENIQRVMELNLLNLRQGDTIRRAPLRFKGDPDALVFLDVLDFSQDGEWARIDVRVALMRYAPKRELVELRFSKSMKLSSPEAVDVVSTYSLLLDALAKEIDQGLDELLK